MYSSVTGGVRHDPQRLMGKTVHVPLFNRDTLEFASRERDKSKPEIKTLLPFLKNIAEESNLENSQDLMVASDACYYYWLHKVISISSPRFGDHQQLHQRCDFRRRFPASQKILRIVWFICIFFSQSERDL